MKTTDQTDGRAVQVLNTHGHCPKAVQENIHPSWFGDEGLLVLVVDLEASESVVPTFA